MVQSTFIKFSTITKLSTTLIIVTILSACASSTVETVNTPYQSYKLKQIAQLKTNEKKDLYEAIIAADKANHEKDYQTATSYYLYAAQASNNSVLIQKTVEAAKKAKDPLGVEQAANLWLANEPRNITAQKLLLESQMAQQDFMGALESTTRLFKRLPSSKQRFQLIDEQIIHHEPRMSFNLLNQLNNTFPNEVAIGTGLSKLVLKLASSNKQPDNMRNQALTEINKVLKDNPDFIPAIKLKSHILFQLRKDNEALDLLSQTFNDNPKSAEASHMLGQLLYDLRDYNAAISHYTDWLSAYPKDLEGRFYLAASYYAEKEFAQSLKHFLPLVDNNYKTEITAFYCGDSGLKINNIPQAEACLKKVTNGRFLTHSKILLSNIYVNKNQIPMALAVLDSSDINDKKNKSRLKIKEIDLINQHIDKKQAQQKLTQALKEDPKSTALILKKIDLFELSKDPNKLLSVLEEAQELFEDSNKLDTYNLAAAALLYNNSHIKLAIDWLNKALVAKPKDKELLYVRALYKEPLGLYKEMIKEFEHLYQLYPDDYNIQNALGFTLADRNIQLNRAEKLINAAYNGLPDSAAVIDSKGWIAFRKGQIDKAINYLTQAFNLSPSADIAAHLGEALWKNKQTEQAKEIWRKGKKLESDNRLLNQTIKRLKVKL